MSVRLALSLAAQCFNRMHHLAGYPNILTIGISKMAQQSGMHILESTVEIAIRSLPKSTAVTAPRSMDLAPTPPLYQHVNIEDEISSIQPGITQNTRLADQSWTYFHCCMAIKHLLRAGSNGPSIQSSYFVISYYDIPYCILIPDSNKRSRVICLLLKR